jgi:hypothetical protein
MGALSAFPEFTTDAPIRLEFDPGGVACPKYDPSPNILGEISRGIDPCATFDLIQSPEQSFRVRYHFLGQEPGKLRREYRFVVKEVSREGMSKADAVRRRFEVVETFVNESVEIISFARRRAWGRVT